MWIIYETFLHCFLPIRFEYFQFLSEHHTKCIVFSRKGMKLRRRRPTQASELTLVSERVRRLERQRNSVTPDRPPQAAGCAQIILIFLKSSEGFNHQNNCEKENYKVCNQLSIEDALYSKACNMWQNYNERQEENKLSCEGEN